MRTHNSDSLSTNCGLRSRQRSRQPSWWDRSRRPALHPPTLVAAVVATIAVVAISSSSIASIAAIIAAAIAVNSNMKYFT